MAKHKMLSRGGTRGAITQKLYSWNPNDVIEAPAGEFDHLGGGDVEKVAAKRKAPAKPKAETAEVKSQNREITSKPRTRKAK